MERNRRRRGRLAVGGIGIAATTAVAGWTAPARAATPTATVRCVSTGRVTSVTGWLAGFEASQPYRSLIVMRAGPSDSSTQFVADVESPTDANGSHDIGVNIAFPELLPVRVAWAVYRDANGDRHYQEAEAVYRGTGDVTACPQDVALSPK
jgi:hypothetical protein